MERDNMLTLTLKEKNTIDIDTADGLITVSLGRIKPGKEGVVLGFTAPRHIQIVRSDVVKREPNYE